LLVFAYINRTLTWLWRRTRTQASA